MTMLTLAAVACIVGLFIGAVGIGGVLLIPALHVLGGLDLHSASATALFTFLFTGLLGTWLFQRRGSIDWRMSLTVCASAVVFSYLGAATKFLIEPSLLNVIIASVVVGAGVYILLPTGRGDRGPSDRAYRARAPLLLLVGAAAGFGSGFSGAGGPVFSVPMMLMLGFAPLPAIGVSQALQIVSAASGTVANLGFGSIDFRIAAWVTVFELTGVVAGVWAAHRIAIRQLRLSSAWICIVVGVAMLMRQT